MAKKKASRLGEAIRKRALSYPETHEDHDAAHVEDRDGRALFPHRRGLSGGGAQARRRRPSRSAEAAMTIVDPMGFSVTCHKPE